LIFKSGWSQTLKQLSVFLSDVTVVLEHLVMHELLQFNVASRAIIYTNSLFLG